MVTVTFYRDSRDRLSRIFATGHAGWADPGRDVVCAAASVVLQTAELGLTEHARVPVTAARDAGRMDLRWDADVRDRTDVAAIVETARLAVEQLARQFPEHVRVGAVRESA
jgi:uncharacterized protein YsxB (DUF464 family)